MYEFSLYLNTRKVFYNPLRKKCPYSDFFWRKNTAEGGKIRTRKTPNTDFFHAVICIKLTFTFFASARFDPKLVLIGSTWTWKN